MNQISQSSLLDFPIRSSLTSDHRRFAIGGELAIRYQSDVAPFASLKDFGEPCFRALADCLPEGGYVILFTAQAVNPPPYLTLRLADKGIQMLEAGRIPLPTDDERIVRLGEQDVPEMMELAQLTKPGPFGPRTIELGTYLGIRENGRLVAMVGERMHFSPYIEISAVCVHPDCRGRGYAKALIPNLVGECREKGAFPMLHVFAQNRAAIKLYERLGFGIRETFHVTVLSR